MKQQGDLHYRTSKRPREESEWTLTYEGQINSRTPLYIEIDAQQIPPYVPILNDWEARLHDRITAIQDQVDENEPIDFSANPRHFDVNYVIRSFVPLLKSDFAFHGIYSA